MKNVVSEEQNVKGIVASCRAATRMAGFVYVDRCQGRGRRARPDPILADASRSATYPIAVVSKSDSKELAQRWIDSCCRRLVRRSSTMPASARRRRRDAPGRAC